MFIFLKYLTFALSAIGLCWAFWGLFKHSWLHRKLVGGEWVQKTEHAGNKFGQPVTFWVRLKKTPSRQLVNHWRVCEQNSPAPESKENNF